MRVSLVVDELAGVTSALPRVMQTPRRRRYEDDEGNPKRVDRSALRIIARWVHEHDGDPAIANDNTVVDRDFYVLDAQRGAERLAPAKSP